MATDFFWGGGGIKLVRTLVPIAVNARKPKMTNAAPVDIPRATRRINAAPKWATHTAVSKQIRTCLKRGDVIDGHHIDVRMRCARSVRI